MAIVIASPRAESWGVAGVVRPGFCVSFILSKNRGKINHAEPGDFLAHTGRLAKAFAGRRHRGKLCSVNLWMALAVPNDVRRWHQAGLPSSYDHVRLARRNGNHLDVPSMSADDTLLSWA